MIRSSNFWIGAILLACVPLLIVDIGTHYLAWQTEVREQVIYAVQDVYNFSKQDKAAILDKAFDRNQTLTLLIAFKAFFSLLLLIAGIYMLSKFVKTNKTDFFKSLVHIVSMAIVFLGLKLLGVTVFNTPQGVKFIDINYGNASFKKLIADNFKGKVVYVDFWGTTCGPCLAEFENFTQPLKSRYKTNANIAYLYLSRGNRYLWKQQIEKYKLDGSHIFLDDKTYDNLYHNALGNDTAMVYMPRYLITSKAGSVVISAAKSPGDKQQLYEQLDMYLNQQ
ncbi:TlpA family protein disulfide reductase [Mucilaginibacter ginsenosidivorax]|uniref:Redoxin domain-containing protein n=1 Tax=Mucilaginibacter ginsenosidivorax TaxID=862126 RepID=A0A5B8W7H6_9SPHI|nr:redoxin family protein [Mucilaginibacter ginsenosidivorax]QEC79844.1 redoxin domain-containing protein [Mucilaginibacter ginsenosidivorax]